MRNWDQLFMLLLGVGVAIQTGIKGLQLFRKASPTAGVGLILLGLSAVAVPIVIVLLRG